MGSDRAEWARRYRTAGWALCATKSENNKQPKGLNWQKQSREPNHWERNPGDGIGIIHGLSGTCSIDLDDLQNARLALEAVGIDSATLDELLQTGVQIVSGRDNRAKLLYRAPTDLPATRHALNWPNVEPDADDECVLELRAGPVHDVLPPSTHPDTGQPYTWRGDRHALPELPDAFAALWHHWELAKANMLEACPWRQVEDVEERIPSGVTLAYNPNGKHNDVIGKFNAAHDLGEILHQHGYRRAGRRWLAPGSSTGIPGVVRLPDTEPLRIYSFHGSDPLADGHAHDAFSVVCQLDHRGNLGAAVAKVAQDMGLEMPIDEKAAQIAERIMRGRRNNAEADVFSIEIAKKAAAEVESIPAIAVGDIPISMGREIQRWIEAPFYQSKRDAVMQATLAFMCAITGRRYSTIDFEPTSGFFGVFDTSQAGIDKLATRVRDLIVQVGEIDMLPGVDAAMTSQYAVYSKFESCPRVIMAGTEYGGILSTSRRQTSGAASSALGAMQAVYDGGAFALAAHTTGGKSRDRSARLVKFPSLTLFSILSEVHVRLMASEAEYERGTLQRKLLLPAGDNQAPSDKIAMPPLPGGLTEIVSRLADTKTLGNNRDNPWLDPRVTQVKFCKDAFDTLKVWRKRLVDECTEPSRIAYKGMAVGYSKSAIRLASALAAWDNPESPIVTGEMCAWSFSWALRCLQLTMPYLERSSVGEDKDFAEAVLELLAKRKTPMTDRELAQASRIVRGTPKDDRETMLTTMVDDGSILAEKTNRTTRYYMKSVVSQ